ncbi:MAG TPA: hypothetical protein VLA72_20280 [Anaerolineales bacterium]|nr:hypothetical protein [Anaerolineales bacterium]
MNMQPVVNGLNETYKDQIEFRELDANAPDGQQAFRAYALPGHPGYPGKAYARNACCPSGALASSSRNSI